MAFGIWHLAFGIWHLAFGIWHLAFGIWHLAFGILWYKITRMKKLTPPEYTKSDVNCLFRLESGDCCNALNYLRPHKCNNGYCVAKLDAWLRKEHPEMDEKTLLETVAELSGHSKPK